MNLKEFEEWALSQGSVANPEPNFKYKGQCVSLIQQMLYLVLGIPFLARGNAKDWANNPDVLSHFDKLSANSSLQKGDILVYGSNYGGGYGHMGFIGSNGKFFDQNGVKKLAVGYRDNPPSGNICVLRSKTGIDTGSSSKNEVPYLVRITADALNIRTGAGTNYPIASGEPHCIRDKGIYTIVEQKDNWGKLKSGAGWICLDYTQRI